MKPGWNAVIMRSVRVSRARAAATINGSSLTMAEGTRAPSKPDISAMRATAAM